MIIFPYGDLGKTESIWRTARFVGAIVAEPAEFANA
jgi:hypothetical protein